MKKNYVYISLLGIFSCSFIFLPSTSLAYTFTRSLKVGDTGSDVLELQKVLNSSVDTQISKVGVGSKGQESTYFGNLTQQAVIKYQNKYKSEILTPSGLTFGTGFVGPATIKKLNNKAVISASTGGYNSYIPKAPTNNAVPSTYQVYDPQRPTATLIPPKTQQSPSTPTTPQNTAVPLVYAFSPREVKPGGIITIYGRNLPASGLVASLGNTPLINITRTPSGEITAQVPENVSPSTYKLTFTHPTLTITVPQIANFSLSPTVSLSPRPQPKVVSVTPTNAGADEVITITGTGFTSDNTISTPMGNLEHVASLDGRTLTFKASQLSRISQAAEIRSKSTSNISKGIAVSVVIVNEGGFSTDAVYFILK